MYKVLLPPEVELIHAKVHNIMRNLLLCMFLCLQHVAGFSPIGISSRQSIISTTSLSSSPATDTSSTSLDGISDFNEWFTSNQGTKINNIKHAIFNWGRGLEFTSRSTSGKSALVCLYLIALCISYNVLTYVTLISLYHHKCYNARLPDLNNVAVVPRKLVLNTPYSDDVDNESYSNWDTKLSCMLWDECQKGKDSLYYGYCSLLTRGANLQSDITEYPSTAPDSLRHWTQEQKSILEKSEKGKKLLDLETKQQIEWKQKYNSLDHRQKSNMSYEQYQWAMEAVHSRAFRGDFGALDGGEGGNLRKIASLLLPLSAIAFGIVYASDPSMDKYFLPLAIVAASPVGLTILADAKGSKEACLLPLIDSANHLQEADSVIEYNPTNNSYELTLGRKCLVKEGERAQACISYGIRKDSELLLNYGFLRGVSIDGSTDDIRQRLALAFLNRNP